MCAWITTFQPSGAIVKEKGTVCPLMQVMTLYVQSSTWPPVISSTVLST
jgi:hypothetical protein